MMETPDMIPDKDPAIAARQRWIGLLARATGDELARHESALRDAEYQLIRAPEIGMTLVVDAWVALARRSTSVK
jgi:alpha-D-ribose 1-methylphosphonate 5-triphosphate synthase subunit PhnG